MKVKGFTCIIWVKVKAYENILIQSADKDLVALEVKYHKRCHEKYTSFLRYSHNDSAQSNDNEGEKYERKYEESFNVFCEEFVKEKLIKQENIFYIYPSKVKTTNPETLSVKSTFGLRFTWI